MRKYHQAGLALTAAFSLVALMFYRHEYNKLRFVLQVFTYFGKPMRNGSYDNCTSNAPIYLRLDSHYLEPQSSWRRLSPNLFVYSSYRRADENEVRTIAFGEDTDIINYSCKVHLENNQEDYYYWDESPGEEIPGEFSYTPIENTHEPQSTSDVWEGDETYSGFILSCKFRKSHTHNRDEGRVSGVEYSLSGGDGDKKKTKKKPNEYVYQNVETIKLVGEKKNNAICIVPFDKSVPPRRMDMISFLSFNDYIGLNNYIVYDSGVISQVFNSVLRAMSTTLNHNFTYTTVIWNFPYGNNVVSSSTVRRIIETDCIYRTFNKAALAVTLEWNEYINIKFHSSLTSLAAAALTNKYRFGLKTVTFCTDQAAHDSFNNSTPIILRATRRLRSYKNTQFTFINKFKDAQSIDDALSGGGGGGDEIATEQSLDLATVNKYEKCHVDDKRQVVENGLLRFAEFTPKSQIFQYFITGKLFYLSSNT